MEWDTRARSGMHERGVRYTGVEWDTRSWSEIHRRGVLEIICEVPSSKTNVCIRTGPSLFT